MKQSMKYAVQAGAAALTLLGAAAAAQQPMECGFISFNNSGEVAVSGAARLQRGVSASPGIEGTISTYGEERPVSGAWEDGAAVLFLGDEGESFTGREYAGRTGSPAYILAGRSGATPVFFFCDPAPAAPPPRPDIAPEPPADERDEPGFAGTVELSPGEFADLDRPAVFSEFSTAIDLAMVAERDGTSFIPVRESVLFGDPYGFSSMSLQRRCDNARSRGRLEYGPIPELTLRRDKEVCFVTGEGRPGAFVVRVTNPRQAVFDIYLFD